jgi:hypothetical protein
MGDGKEVVREVRRRAKRNQSTHDLVERRGYAFWLAPDYIKDVTPEVEVGTP